MCLNMIPCVVSLVCPVCLSFGIHPGVVMFLALLMPLFMGVFRHAGVSYACSLHSNALANCGEENAEATENR